jgi:hypothetical protein
LFGACAIGTLLSRPKLLLPREPPSLCVSIYADCFLSRLPLSRLLEAGADANRSRRRLGGHAASAGPGTPPFAARSSAWRCIPRFEFVTKHQHVAGGLDADADLVARDFYNCDNDRVADSDPLGFFP